MSWFKRKPKDDCLAALVEEAEARRKEREEATQRLVRTAESVSRQQKEKKLAEQIETP